MPGTGFLTPDEIIERLRTAFAVVDTNAAEGVAHSGRLLQRLRQMGGPPNVIEHLEQNYERSVAVVVMDSAGSSPDTLTFVLVPGKGFSIYARRDLLPMVERCRLALGYRMGEL